MLRFMNPRDSHANDHIFWVLLLNERASLISTSRYLELNDLAKILNYKE